MSRNQGPEERAGGSAPCVAATVGLGTQASTTIPTAHRMAQDPSCARGTRSEPFPLWFRTTTIRGRSTLPLISNKRIYLESDIEDEAMLRRSLELASRVAGEPVALDADQILLIGDVGRLEAKLPVDVAPQREEPGDAGVDPPIVVQPP